MEQLAETHRPISPQLAQMLMIGENFKINVTTIGFTMNISKIVVNANPARWGLMFLANSGESIALNPLAKSTAGLGFVTTPTTTFFKFTFDLDGPIVQSIWSGITADAGDSIIVIETIVQN